MKFEILFTYKINRKLMMAGFIHVREMSGKFKFFQGQGILCCVRKKSNFAKMSG